MCLPLSGLSWISTAEIPLHYSMDNLYSDLVADFPDFLIRGLDAGMARYLKQRGSDVIRTGAEAVIDLNKLDDLKPSVMELARRGGRCGAVNEIPYSEFHAKKVSRFIEKSSHAPEPKLTYLFRSGFDRNTRCFVLASDEDRWLGAVTVSAPQESYAHTEMMLRGKNAPVGVMEALFVSVMRTLRDEGYSHFSLGEVPFISTEVRDSAPGSSRGYVKEFILSSKHLLKYSFNYKGLYDFKNKFGPVWKPVYVCASPGLSIYSLIDLFVEAGFLRLTGFKAYSGLRSIMSKLVYTF